MKLNLISLSDEFRRDFSGDRLAEKSPLADLVRLTRELIVLSSYYRPEYDINNHVNKKPIDQMKQRLFFIAAAAVSHVRDTLGRGDVSITVTLPFAGKSPNGSLFGKKLGLRDAKHAKVDDVSVAFDFQSRPYKKDLEIEFGPINPEIPTCLDDGLTGLCNVNRDLIYTWRKEEETKGQRSFDFMGG